MHLDKLKTNSDFKSSKLNIFTTWESSVSISIHLDIFWFKQLKISCRKGKNSSKFLGEYELSIHAKFKGNQVDLEIKGLQ